MRCCCECGEPVESAREAFEVIWGDGQGGTWTGQVGVCCLAVVVRRGVGTGGVVAVTAC